MHKSLIELITLNFIDELCKFEQLEFALDDKVNKAITQGKQVATKLSNDLCVICPVFDKVGKVEMKQIKVI